MKLNKFWVKDMASKFLNVKLADLIHLHYGDALKSEVRKEGKIPVFGSNGIVGYHNQSLIDYPTVIIGRKGSVGAANYAPFPSWVIDTAYYAEIKNEQALDLKYFFNFAQSIDIKKISQKGVKPGVNRNDYLALEIPLPPLPEQRRIVAKLDSLFERIDRAIELIEQNIAHSRQFMASVLSDVFDGSLKNYVVVPLMKYVDFIGGSQPAKQYFSQTIKDGYIRLIQIRDYKSDDYIVFIKSNSTKKFCDETDVMIGRYGPPVFQILRGIKGAYNVALMKALPDERYITKDYLYWFLQNSNIQHYIINISQRSAGQSGVNKSALEKYNISLPPLKIQEKISNYLLEVHSNHRQLLRKQGKRLKVLSEMKSSLLDAAFKGEL